MLSMHFHYLLSKYLKLYANIKIKYNCVNVLLRLNATHATRQYNDQVCFY